MTETVDIVALLELPESEVLDFKATSYDLSNPRKKRDFAKDLASLANTPREGDAYIVLGVKKYPDGRYKLWGIDDAIDDADLQSVASSLLEPSPRFSFQPIRHNDTLLGLIIIPPDRRYPVTPKRTDGTGFVEGHIYYRRGSQNADAPMYEQERIWDWFRGRSITSTFSGPGDGGADSANVHLYSESLLLGPVEALGLTSKVERAQHLDKESPADAADLYAEISSSLRIRFPEYADRFEQLRATALRESGNLDESHDLLMKFAIRQLVERAEPQLPHHIRHALGKMHNDLGEVQQARGGALIHYGRWHEDSREIQRLAERFDGLGSDDEYSGYVATLLAEVAVADGSFHTIRDREKRLEEAAKGRETSIGLRIRAALGDAGVERVWPNLIRNAEALRFSAPEGTYICLRGARWCAWNGDTDKAESLCRQAMKLGSEAGLDLDIENALWSLTFLYTLRDPSKELFETNRRAMSIEGSNSYVKANSRTKQRSYQYIVHGQLPDAHLWARYRLLESIRGGSLGNEIESHVILARIYDQSEEHLNALEHAILGGSQKLVKELAQQISEWPDYLPEMLVGKAPWVRRAALFALEHVGDFAPPGVARGLAGELLDRLHGDSEDTRSVSALLNALVSTILEATDKDIKRLMPFLEQAAVRVPSTYRLTDPGVLTLASRLYRFRPKFRTQAASVLAEIAVGGSSQEWRRALNACEDDTEELMEAMTLVAERADAEHVVDSLADLKQLTPDTRDLWTRRLQFVEDYPLEKRASHTIGLSFDVSEEFLREQGETIALQYIDKLVAIGKNEGEPVGNRADALAAASDVIDLLSDSEKARVFEQVRPLVEQSIRGSDMDQFQAGTQHPLSRFQISFGSDSHVQGSAGWVLACAATNPTERSLVINLALRWIRSDDNTLQYTGSSLLTLQNLASNKVQLGELAKHQNPLVRCKVVRLPDMQATPDMNIFEELASDPDRRVRLAVVQAISSVHSMNPDAYEHLREKLKADPSAFVRASASTLQVRRGRLQGGASLK